MLISTNVCDGETQAAGWRGRKHALRCVSFLAGYPPATTRVPLSPALAFFLSLVDFALARPATGKRIAAEWFIWPWWPRVAGLWKEGACFFLTITARNGREIKFRRYSGDLSLMQRRILSWNPVDLRLVEYRILILEYSPRLYLWRDIEFCHLSFWNSAIYLGCNVKEFWIFWIDYVIKFLEYFNILRMETLLRSSDILCD